METYRIENLTFAYPNREKPALRGVDLSIAQGSFVTICGASGCGKTTLLRQLKPSTAPYGVKSGAVFFDGVRLEELSARHAASKIGFIMQSVENQIVTEKVWHELAFGLESLGVKTPEIRLRVAEMANFFGIQTWFHKSVTELSGGQKQLLALASVMVMQPSVLILDEPTSQLDPIAAGEFLTMVSKINCDLGITVILTEHRLEEVLPLSSHVVVMDNGRIIAEASPQKIGLLLHGQNHKMFSAMPTPMRIWAACTKSPAESDNCPITINEGATWLQGFNLFNVVRDTYVPQSDNKNDKKPAITLKDVWFRYERNSLDVVKGLSFAANYGELTAILGGNGTGKTTMLSLVAGIFSPSRGKIHADTRVYLLPQNPQSLFIGKTVREDLLEIAESPEKLTPIVKLCHLENLLDSHPYDLSGGEQQRAALAKVLLLQPKILLLDEPTKGLDAEYKQIFAAIMQRMTAAGAAIVMVSHDIEFCAEYADKCALFFDGDIFAENPPREFFSGNSFYTTSANRMARRILPNAITANDVIQALGGEVPTPPKILDDDIKYEAESLPPPPATPELSPARKGVLSIFGLWLIATMLFAVLNPSGFDGFLQFLQGGHSAITTADNAILYVGILFAMISAIIGITFTLSWKRNRGALESQLQKRELSKRTIVAAIVILLTIPATIFIGLYFFDDRRFYFISMAIIFQTMLPFALVFEGRKPMARELVIIAVLCAISVAGRTAFFMMPQFKPVIAMVIIAGVAFGGETGFLVGAITGFVSNMFFGQGPWTPWQMFAFGIIGFLSGVLFRKGLLRRTRLSLAVFGGVSTLLIYGGIMNPAGVLIHQPSPTIEMFLMSYLQGIPFDIIHAVATVIFLAVASRPMLEKLDRIKDKYGLVEY